ncbi:MAG: hypothetical protein JXQ65_15735 [Candidatus Marinimicrobia bacterium]|nr:hypothetical protein [Candidatus Neomarinimicrobiota bacterium]
MKIISLILLSLVYLYSQEFKKVYIIASYEESHFCGQPQETGVLKGLVKSGFFENMNLVVKRFYMDTKRTNTTRELMQKVGLQALQEIAEYQPNVVITLDDNAFREVGMKLISDDRISVIFSGLNGQLEDYNLIEKFSEGRQPVKNITGIYEKLYVYQSIRVMQNAVPSARDKIFVGITDYSPTGNAITKQLNLELSPYLKDIKWELVRVRDWDEYVNVIHDLNNRQEVGVIYPIALTLQTRESETNFTAPEIFAWTIEHSRLPDMALNYHFSKVGLFGGAAVNFEHMGFQAGKMAGKVLSGKSVSNLPIEDAQEYSIVFNIKRASQLGIEIPGPLLMAADILFKE